MPSYKEIFAKYGYALFEPESLEVAIIDALKERNLRYLYGIPIMLEKSSINLDMLVSLAKKDNVLQDLKEIFFITSKIISDRKLASNLKALSKGITKTAFHMDEFRNAYEDYAAAKKYAGFAPAENFQLSFLFAKKQIEILYKIRIGEQLTKTEKEYFSRVIKKKLVAIRELHPLAKEILVRE